MQGAHSRRMVLHGLAAAVGLGAARLVPDPRSPEEVTPPPSARSAQCEPCPPERKRTPPADCTITPVATRRASIEVIAQDYALEGRHFLPQFDDLVPAHLQPAAVEAEVEAWARRCLPDGSFRVLVCRAYPCVFAFEEKLRDPSCLDDLDAMRLLRGSGTPGAYGEDLPSPPPLLFAVFRDPADVDRFGEHAETGEYRARIRAFQPWMEHSGHEPDEVAMEDKAASLRLDRAEVLRDRSADPP